MPGPVTAPAPSRPRPPLVYDHRALFREPVYDDGQPYADQADDPDEA